MENRNVMLVAFYNKKALGVRYLETALVDAGYKVRNVFYKDFNSVHPQPTTEKELEILKNDIADKKPLFIGLSAMSSMYLDTVNAILKMIHSNFDIPVFVGGAFTTMCPEYFLNKEEVTGVLISDGERSIVKVANALREGKPYYDIPCLGYKKDGEIVINPTGDIPNDINEYGLPAINSPWACYIDHDTLTEGDPQLDTMSYEVVASRGCPFTCSYCGSNNLKHFLPKGVHGVRTRSVENVIAELREAKRVCKNIKFFHFYDEIFPNLPGWVDEFCVQYKKYINYPFTIWTHPKMTDPEVLKKLVSVGLTEVIMGIQTGSDRIRRQVFHRFETSEDIVSATKKIRASGVFWTSYDFMLQHPFEEIEDLKDSYYLGKRMQTPYELQLHGLNFLPGTDIVQMAIDAGYYTKEQMDEIMFGSMEQQFGTFWHRDNGRESDLWYKMLYCLQFKSIRPEIESFESDPMAHAERIDALYEKGQKIYKYRYLYRKVRIALRRYTMQIFK
ncbi:MAG: B12-binding domain-containing radical SAM protein [Clostridia bacterium]|nr:B12-binding domain-containing radical SAM protein [Clostridia bacterium]